VAAFAARVDDDVSAIATCLRNNSAAPDDPGLRAAQRSLAVALEAEAHTDDEHALAAAWIDASDRIVDSINTLVHLLGAKKGLRAEG
jgi:hypothetical protein